MESKLRMLYRVEGGILDGTEIEPFMFTVLVRYPHRKTPDCYIPPMKAKGKTSKTWHCCQDNCPQPNFKGGLEALLEHILLHKGKLVRPWTKKKQLKTPIPAVRLPANPWNGKTKGGGNAGVNEDRRFCIDLYIDDIKCNLRKQGLEIIED